MNAYMQFFEGKKGKDVPVTDHGCPWGRETSKTPTFF
jgi:hypothetical protein